MFDGQKDVDAAAASLAKRIPYPLAGLARLAYNYRWAWQPGGSRLFERIDPRLWLRVSRNPVALLQEATAESLRAAAADPELLAAVAAADDALEADLARESAGSSNLRAFFCAEYAVHSSLPIYSGGLGALAGDFLKQASDDALPLVGVGLLYREGYFRQRIDGTGLQHEYWVAADPNRLPLAQVSGADGAPLTVTVPIAGEDVVASIWRLNVGRVPLYLLDSDLPENSRTARWIVSRLYVGSPQVRLAQYMLLGVGGVRALEAMGVAVERLHLNEGHAAFAALELMRRDVEAGLAADAALEHARERIAFTTHTPVPAGNDTYPLAELERVAGRLAAAAGLDSDGLARLGRSDPERADEPFGMTQFALHTSSSANAVSRRHGEVAREMWQELWPERPLAKVPITYVTNGVHMPTWIGAPMRTLLERRLGADLLSRADDPELWAAVETIEAAELWEARNAQRARLVATVRDRSVAERLGRGDELEYATAAAEGFQPDVLTIGFARRIATYKRLALLVADREGALGLLRAQPPIQIVLAGKAHPRDDEAKALLRELFEMKAAPEVGARVVFLDDYDLASAAQLVQGCDVWVNVPRPPLEASGTSGMKSALNGGLQLSVLDGWWAEGYDDDNGWALSGEVDPDTEAQDARDGAELHRLLAQEVLPLFYERDADGLPQRWLEMMRRSLRTLGPEYNAERMLRDYRERVYRD